MSYDYAKEKAEYILTDEGGRAVAATWEVIRPLVEKTGAITIGKAMNRIVHASDSFKQLAVIHRLCEIGLLRPLVIAGATQDQILVPGP